MFFTLSQYSYVHKTRQMSKCQPTKQSRNTLCIMKSTILPSKSKGITIIILTHCVPQQLPSATPIYWLNWRLNIPVITSTILLRTFTHNLYTRSITPIRWFYGQVYSFLTTIISMHENLYIFIHDQQYSCKRVVFCHFCESQYDKVQLSYSYSRLWKNA